MGHHHGHHGGHHHHRGGRGGAGTSWPLAIGLMLLLAAYGLFDVVSTARIYFGGHRGQGVVTTYDAAANTTLVEVEGHVCAVGGQHGHVGRMVPVAYPAGRPGSCVVRDVGVFRWGAGALLLAALLLGAVLAIRKDAASTA